ncbi:MAG TPA: ParB/RepB/Spo0J family partition protein [Gammaproteobacteria bacterium]|nr:ParB/RepB/Spo0J family partition protein [Gammaproteobacteria bacterium]
MPNKRKALGRSFDTLLSSAASAERAEGDLKNLPVDLIQRGKYQPRVDMHADSLQDLADSIKAQGVVQPVVVRPIGGGKYELIAGERRWRASQMAGLHEIPAVVRDVEDRAAIAMALIENIQRENLNPLEEARALERLIDEFDMTHEQAAEAVGRSRAAVSNLLRLLDLGAATRKLVEDGKLEMGHARALLGLKGTVQDETARIVATRGLSVREAEALVRRQLADKPAPPPRRLDPDVRRLQEDLSGRLGARVTLQPGPKGRGKLIITYTSLDELDGILEHIK